MKGCQFLQVGQNLEQLHVKNTLVLRSGLEAASSSRWAQSRTVTCKGYFSLEVRIRGCQFLQMGDNLEQVHVKNTLVLRLGLEAASFSKWATIWNRYL
jgi:hypothetical protein